VNRELGGFQSPSTGDFEEENTDSMVAQQSYYSSTFAPNMCAHSQQPALYNTEQVLMRVACRIVANRCSTAWTISGLPGSAQPYSMSSEYILWGVLTWIWTQRLSLKISMFTNFHWHWNNIEILIRISYRRCSVSSTRRHTPLGCHVHRRKIKLPMCLTEHYAMKTCGEWGRFYWPRH
jgi:hypothetical protein